MKRFLLGLVLMLVTVGVCQAQTLTTVTGTVNDSTGNLATSGTVTFTLAPNSNSILYYVSGLDVIAPVAGSCGINGSGQIKNLALSSVCQVWGNDVISPANTTYTVQFLPNGTPGMLVRQLLITGTTYSLSSPVFAPQVQINPQFATYYALPIQSNMVPIADSVFNLGASNFRYANGYFTNLTVTNSFAFSNLTVTGPLHVTGTSTLDGAIVVASTAPVAHLAAGPIVYNHSGTQAINTHMVSDTCVLGTSCSITLTGSSVFTGASSYACTASDTTSAAAVKIVQSSGSALVLTGTGTDTLQYTCVGD